MASPVRFSRSFGLVPAFHGTDIGIAPRRSSRWRGSPPKSLKTICVSWRSLEMLQVLVLAGYDDPFGAEVPTILFLLEFPGRTRVASMATGETETLSNVRHHRCQVNV